jgi:DNA polymerase-1
VNILTIDTEQTIQFNGDPFYGPNKLVCVSYYGNKAGSGVLPIEYGNRPYGGELAYLDGLIQRADLLVGFNLKRDLHWLKRYGINIPYKPVYCVQLTEFILGNQREVYPALDDVSVRYGLGNKLDYVRINYWERGINTDQVPWNILEEYALDDAVKTHRLYEAQKILIEKRSKAFQELIRLEMEDLLILQNMEWNGFKYDYEGSRLAQQQLEQELKQIDLHLHSLVDCDYINWNSGDQLSAVLFGGKIKHEWKEEDGVFKSGNHTGEPRYKWFSKIYEFPRLVEPLRKLKKEGVFSTDEDTLNNLKTKGLSKKIVELILRRSKLEKLLGTYIKGIPDRIEEMEWADHIVHGKYNQTVAVTGRLSSSEPNLQNNPPEVDQFFISRYVD